MAWENPSDVDDALIREASNDVYDDNDWVDPLTLSEPLQTCWAIENSQAITDNGGLQYFFENDWLENLPYAFFIEAYHRIGAKEAADCLADAVAQFPFSEPHLYYEQRREYMEFSRSGENKYDSLIDKLGNRMIELSADTYTKLAAYVRVNIEVFPRAKAFLKQKK